MKILNWTLRTTLLFVIVSFDAFAQGDSGRPLPQFLFPGFTKGVVRMKSGTTFSSSLNYNTVDEIMVTELNGTYRYATRPAEIDTILLVYKKFVPVGQAFYEVIVDGPVTFLLQNKSNLTPKGSDIGYGSKSRGVAPTSYTRYELTNVCYQYNDVVHMDLPSNVEVTSASVCWIKTGNMMEKFNTENQFLKIFPERKDQLKEFIRKEKLNLKDSEDLFKLGNFCNEIMN
jgi:hypothetical protein